MGGRLFQCTDCLSQLLSTAGLQTPAGLGFGLIEFRQLDFLRQANLRQQPDAPVVGVDLIPGQAVLGGDRMGMVVVVPAFAAAHQRHPPVVARVVAGLKAPAAPHVGGRVDQPGGVQAESHAQECAPQQPADGAVDSRRPVQPTANSSTPLAVSGIQWYLLSQTWKRSRARSGE